jgi:serine O-acetyltransferase
MRGINVPPENSMDEHSKTVIDAILHSYAAGDGINHVDGANLPSKQAIADICNNLLQVLFPGYHDAEPIHRQDLPRLTTRRVTGLAQSLTAEISKSLRLRTPECPDEMSAAHVDRFLLGLPRVLALLATDVEAAFTGDPAAGGREEVILSYPCVEALAIQRAAHVLHELGVPLIPRMMTEWVHSRTGIDIHPGAKIGTHFFIDHGTGVVIGETSVIGDRVKLYQGVSLIARSLAGGQALRGQRRHPTLESDVTIYANTTIMGGDTVIGAGSTIGASVFLTHSVPARSLVLAEGKGVKVLDKNTKRADVIDWMI